MKPIRQSVLKLVPCKWCNYVACVCIVLRHDKSCPWRLTLLSTSPVVCAPHEKTGCVECNPCNCGKPTRAAS
jgi:hypothetical protein